MALEAEFIQLSKHRLTLIVLAKIFLQNVSIRAPVGARWGDIPLPKLYERESRTLLQ